MIDINSLDYVTEEGNVYGYITNTVTDEQLENYLNEQGKFGAVQKIQSKYKKIAILTNMYIEEEYRGQGNGTCLLERFIDDAILSEVEAILLVADTGESNEFDLVKWYEEYEFEIIDSERDSYPVMVKIID